LLDQNSRQRQRIQYLENELRNKKEAFMDINRKFGAQKQKLFSSERRVGAFQKKLATEEKKSSKLERNWALLNNIISSIRHALPNEVR
jgi:chromosome segregation ATPase